MLEKKTVMWKKRMLTMKVIKEVSYGDFGLIPVGTQCVIINENTMFIGLWGKNLLAHWIS